MSLRNRRKHVMNEAQWDDCQLPAGNHYIVKVLKSVGNNLHMVTTPNEDVCHVSMPMKFRKTIWVKRGDFVLVEPIPEGKKVKAEIVKVLNQKCIQFYQKNNVWPTFVDSKLVKKQEEENLNKNLLTQLPFFIENECGSCDNSSNSDSGRGSEDDDVEY